MCTTPRRSIALQQLDENSWHLDAMPADTVLVGLRHLLKDDPPDLVLSGINFGPNLGVGLHASGTIGAAVMALINGVPAIAVSAGMFFHEYNHSPRRFPSTHDVLDPCSTSTTRHCPKATSRACFILKYQMGTWLSLATATAKMPGTSPPVTIRAWIRNSLSWNPETSAPTWKATSPFPPSSHTGTHLLNWRMRSRRDCQECSQGKGFPGTRERLPAEGFSHTLSQPQCTNQSSHSPHHCTPGRKHPRG